MAPLVHGANVINSTNTANSMNSVKGDNEKDVRPRISGRLYRLIRLGAALSGKPEKQWLDEAVQEKAAKERVLIDTVEEGSNV